MDADHALAAVFALNDSDLSSLSGDSSDNSADSTDLWLSSDSSAEDGDSDDTHDLDDEQEGSAGSDSLGDDLNDSSDEDGVETVSDRLVNISFCYVHGLGVKGSQILSASRKCVGCHTKYVQGVRYKTKQRHGWFSICQVWQNLARKGLIRDVSPSQGLLQSAIYPSRFALSEAPERAKRL